MLLDLEPNIAKKVPVLLWIESYDQALRNALVSKDSNLINMVILKLLKSGSLSDKEIYELMKYLYYIQNIFLNLVIRSGPF